MSVAGVVSRVSPVQTALRNCTRDEGGPFEFGNQVLISSHRKPLSSKAMVVNVAETLGHDLSRQGRERRAQANRCRSVESGLGDVKTEGSPALRDQLGGCPEFCLSGIRRAGGAKLDQALVRNVRTCAPMQRERSQAAQTARIRVPMRSNRGGAARSSCHRLCRPTANETL